MIQWDNNWIAKHYDGLCTTNLLQQYNKEHNCNIKMDTFRKHIGKKMGIHPDSFFYTEEQKEFLLTHYEKIGMKKTTDMFNDRFNTDKSFECIHRLAQKLGLNVNKDVANHNANPVIDPIGTIREEPSTGYYVIKTKDKWIKYNRYLYEQHYGKIPKNYSVIFLDGNNRNFDISNLMAIPTKYVVYMNTNRIRSNDPEITKTAIVWCKLYEALRERNEMNGS